jgi:broad specificity phosphatase PhoE
MGNNGSMSVEIYLIRHASPDRSSTGLPYDILPGPPLSQRGVKEAEALAEFLKAEGVVKLYSSPFERSARTALLISSRNGIPCIEDARLSEWRSVDETEARVSERMSSIFEHATRESAEIGPIGLVSHGGPVGILLQTLGINQDELALHRKMFDQPNPLPPAGVWKAEQDSGDDSWILNLEFVPKVG